MTRKAVEAAGQACAPPAADYARAERMIRMLMEGIATSSSFRSRPTLESGQSIAPRLRHYLESNRPETPVLVVDLTCVERSYHALHAVLPGMDIYYAVKANPAPEIIVRLARLGCHFDVAGPAEIGLVLAAGVTPDRLSYGNTIKKERDIAEAFRLGVRLFAVDAKEEVRKIARVAPGSRVFCRILTDSEGAEWPLSRKFGCAPEMSADVLRTAARLGLVPYGLSFHVGSQQTDPGQWELPIQTARRVFETLEREGIRLCMLNLGGGFPASYRRPVPAPAAYGAHIRESIHRHFGERVQHLIVEPGRGLVGDAGVIETEVVLISHKHEGAGHRWVYLDIGKFGGLAETADEMIQYAIASNRTGAPQPVILAGPTCDSMDILYERARYCLPSDLRVGDRLRIAGTGAYTASYSAVGFNGFPPLRVVCI